MYSNNMVCEDSYFEWKLEFENRAEIRSKVFGSYEKWCLVFNYHHPSASFQFYRESCGNKLQIKGRITIKYHTYMFKEISRMLDFTINEDIKHEEILSLDMLMLSQRTADVSCYICVAKLSEETEKSVQTYRDLQSPNSLTPMSALDMKSIFGVCRDMQAMFENRKHSDSILLCNDIEIRVHKCILAARSPVFAQMFDDVMTGNVESKIIVTEVDLQVLKEMLQFIYTGEINLRSQSMACDMYCAGDKYAILDLKNMCREFIISSLSTSTAIDMLILADKYHDEELMKGTTEFIASVFEDIKITEVWSNFLQNICLRKESLLSEDDKHPQSLNAK
ncbi:speckle-type POZ protein-like [Stegodyphus dumicola]|uniref:speckle-type POZ protein-like n=1 Tax=Stegodyphus dumicola TaxID=202533 RepID=UPI0015B2CFE2|nr:speckle-type POZ protein-like [Stegodyphus dumicola]